MKYFWLGPNWLSIASGLIDSHRAVSSARINIGRWSFIFAWGRGVPYFHRRWWWLRYPKRTD